MHVIDLSDDASEEGLKVLRTFDSHLENAGKATGVTVTTMASSADGQWLASADTAHRVHVFNLDSVSVSPTFPPLPSQLTSLLASLHPTIIPPSPHFPPILPLPSFSASDCICKQ